MNEKQKLKTKRLGYEYTVTLVSLEETRRCVITLWETPKHQRYDAAFLTEIK